MVSNREKMKIAKRAERSGGAETAWAGLKNARGGRGCKGCGKAWDKMTAKELNDHAKCKDKDGCPETDD